MTINGFKLEGDWKVSNMGFTAKAEKDGKRYFLKKYGEFKMPRHDESTTAKLYNRLENEFRQAMDYRIAINTALTSLSGPGGNIVVPRQWFVDDIYFVEATEFIENVVDEDDVLRLPLKDKMFIMLTAAGALYGIHRKNIVHSDLKRQNILVSRNATGNLVAKIFDVDRSYFANDIRPAYIGGDQNFMSPELANCFMYEMADEAVELLSTKSDIFSLGLVFHDYLADGDHPSIEGLTGRLKDRADSGKTVYCAEALLSGAKLVISDKIKEKYLINLLISMLQLEPEDRPTAQEVLEVLKTNKVMDIKPDSPVVSRLSGAELEPEVRHDTRVVPERTTSKPTGFAEPWEGHDIVFDSDKLKEAGYVASERMAQGSSKVYKLFKSNGDFRVFNVDLIVRLGWATEKGGSAPKPSVRPPERSPERSTPPEPVSETVHDDGQLWEGGYEFNMDAIKRVGFTNIAKTERNGAKVYVLTKADGEKRYMAFNQLKMLDFLIKKDS